MNMDGSVSVPMVGSGVSYVQATKLLQSQQRIQLAKSGFDPDQAQIPLANSPPAAAIRHSR